MDEKPHTHVPNPHKLPTKRERRRIDSFHKLYYDIYPHCFFFGRYIQKNPMDLWIYQEIISQKAPDLIIETGTGNGGGALYLACMLELVGNGKIVTVDDTPCEDGVPEHRRIKYIRGSSTDPDVAREIHAMAGAVFETMIILDSDHGKSHVLKEMQLYGDLVTSGQYLIVEDSNINGYPVRSDFGPGPREAIEEYLADPINEGKFEVDRSMEKYLITYNPGGYLKRLGLAVSDSGAAG